MTPPLQRVFQVTAKVDGMLVEYRGGIPGGGAVVVISDEHGYQVTMGFDAFSVIARLFLRAEAPTT